jgi:hypothetical protein
MRVHRFCQIDWLHRHDLEVVLNDPFFADSTTSVTRIMFNCTLRFPSGGGEPHPILIQEHKESRCMLGSFGMTISHLRVIGATATSSQGVYLLNLALL